MLNREKIRKIIRKVVSFYNRLDTCQKLYLNLIISAIFIMVLWPILDVGKKKAFFTMIIIYWTAIVAYESVRIYKKIYSFTLGKAFILLGFTLCTNLALCIAGVVINDITTVSPSNFPHALILLSIATIPFILAIAMLFIYLIIFVTMPIWGMIVLIYDNKLKKILFPGYEPLEGYFLYKTTRVVQIITISIYCIFFHASFQNMLNDYTTFITSKSQSFIYMFEMYEKSPCVGIPPGKVSFINDDHVLHAHKENGKLVFKTLSCEYTKI